VLPIAKYAAFSPLVKASQLKSDPIVNVVNDRPCALSTRMNISAGPTDLEFTSQAMSVPSERDAFAGPHVTTASDTASAPGTFPPLSAAWTEADSSATVPPGSLELAVDEQPAIVTMVTIAQIQDPRPVTLRCGDLISRHRKRDRYFSKTLEGLTAGESAGDVSWQGHGIGIPVPILK